MNCQAFLNVVIDLVGNGAVEEPTRSQALLHAQSCPECAQQLNGQRALSMALHTADGCEAPTQVEAAVLAAYRSRFGRPAAAAPKRYRLLWGLAAAAALVLTGSLLFTRLHQQAPEPRQAQSPRVEIQARPTAPVVEAAESEALRLAAAPVQAREVRKPAPKPVPQPAAEPEIATDFIALTSGAEISAMESGQFVRVMLPRRAMASFGLPYNQERADTPVSAQVLIGQDGVARAIRFLNDSKSDIVQTGLHSKR